MKKMQKKTQRLCSDFDSRPIYDPSDNLYAGNEYDENLNTLKKLKTERNSEKIEENYL